MEKKENEAISHRAYPRSKQRPAIVRSILSYVKRCESYETIGGLFAEITKNSVELSVAERIWLLIVEVINVIAEVLNCNTMVLTEQIISNDKQIKAIKMAFDRLTPAA